MSRQWRTRIVRTTSVALFVLAWQAAEVLYFCAFYGELMAASGKARVPCRAPWLTVAGLAPKNAGVPATMRLTGSRPMWIDEMP